MTELEECLILSTIKEGAENPSNKRFSTKEIARCCRISEYTLFSLFKTKERLVTAANDYIMNEIIEASKKAATASSNVQEYVRKMLFFGFSKPMEMTFLANYGFWNGKTEKDPERISRDYEKAVLAAKEAFHFLKDYDEVVYFLVWSYITRNINYFVETVYDGIIRDSIEYRDFCASLLNAGSSILVEGGTK